jgi:hypothetical protein
MNGIRAGIGLAGVLVLSACVVQPPAGPSVVAMPPSGKSWEQFQSEDAICRQAASQASGGMQAAQGATNNAVGTAVVGTALGAAAGALVGSTVGAVGTGAAVGAGAGLLMGSSVGANGAQYSAYDLQQRYNITYVQCMSAKGNIIQQPAAPPPAAYAPGPYPYYAAPYPYYYGPRYYRYGY